MRYLDIGGWPENPLGDMPVLAVMLYPEDAEEQRSLLDWAKMQAPLLPTDRRYNVLERLGPVFIDESRILAGAMAGYVLFTCRRIADHHPELGASIQKHPAD